MVGLWLTPIPAVLLLLLSYLLVNLISIAWISLWWRRGISEKARGRGIWETRAGEGISYSGIQRTLRIVQSTGLSERNGSTHYEGQDCWVVGMHQTCSQRLESGNQKEQEQGRCNVKRWELVQGCCPKRPELSEPVFASKERSSKVMKGHELLYHSWASLSLQSFQLLNQCGLGEDMFPSNFSLWDGHQTCSGWRLFYFEY